MSHPVVQPIEREIWDDVTQRYSVPPTETRRAAAGDVGNMPDSGIIALGRDDAKQQRPRVLHRESVPLDVVQAILLCTTEYLGPAARPVLSSELRKLGVTAQSLAWVLVPVLVAGLAARLDTPAAVNAFSRAIQLAHPDLRNYWDRLRSGG